MKKLFIVLSILSVFVCTGCDLSGAFTQPTVVVNNFELKQLPGESATILVSSTVTNVDKRSADISTVIFVATVEDFVCKEVTYEIDGTIEAGENLEVILPITLSTSDAIELLEKMQKGEVLDFSITGKFFADIPFLGETELPLSVDGKSSVIKGIDDFFKQPTVVVKDYELSELPGDTVLLDVKVDVTNNDSKGATVVELEYVANIEGIISSEMNEPFNEVFSAGQTKTLTMQVELPTVGATSLLSKLELDGEVDFTIVGLFDIEEVDLGSFKLPLDIAGKATVVKGIDEYFEQPTIIVNKYQITSIYNINFSTFTADVDLDVNVKVTNNDTHGADITKVVYTCVIEGLTSDEEVYSTVFSLEATGDSADNEILDMPLTLKNVPASIYKKDTVNYVITGYFYATATLETDPLDFVLPLHVEGSTQLEQLSP